MRVGFVGLGVMGLPMATHIGAALGAGGGSLTLFNRTVDHLKPLLEQGAGLAGNARELAAASDLVVFMVPAIAQIRGLLDGPDGILAGVSGPLTLVVCSTCSPQDVRDLQADLTAVDARLRVVDAPVSGGAEGAAAGTLSIMVGGEQADVAPVLTALSPAGRTLHLGPLGAGQVAKACNQLIVAAEVVALAEASLLAERAGLDVAKLFDLLSTGYAASRVLEVKAERFVNHDHSPSGPAKFLVKDLRAVREEALRSGLKLVSLDALLGAYTDLTDAGLGDLDSSVVQRWIEQGSPLPGRESSRLT